MADQHYDLIVIGGGQGGDPLVRAFAKAGRSAALIERDEVGGTCVNWGCTPTKTMIASGRVAWLARRAAEYGIQTGPVSVDMKRIHARKDDIVHDFRSGTEKSYQKLEGLDLIRGNARFTGPKTVEVILKNPPVGSVEALKLSADLIVINTGLRTAIPPVEGIDAVSYLDNRSTLELDEVPEHLIVLGGGYIGLEFAQLFRRLGSAVTLVHRGCQLLDREDEDIAKAVQDILVEDGLRVLLETDAKSIRQTSEALELTVEASDGQREVIRGSHLLVATGRKPNTEELNLPAAGVETDEKGFVSVDERLETTAESIYAIGDVKGGPAFTHISYDDFRILRANLLEGKQRTTGGRLVPYVVFIDPQLGRVGMTEKEARESGLPIRVAKYPVTETARGLETGESRGLLKAVVHAETNQILGAAILCLEGGEIMASLEVAMMGGLPYTVFRDGIFAHPTMTESLNNLFMRMDEQL